MSKSTNLPEDLSGDDLLAIRDITGHKTLKMLARYNKTSEKDLRRAIE